MSELVERQMRRFKSAAHAQRFLLVHGLVRNLFRVGRHLLRAGSPPPVENSGLPGMERRDRRVLTREGSPTSKGSSRTILVNLTVPSRLLCPRGAPRGLTL